ncbi:MAG: hypothetical protein WDO56_29915 [Gammaproteobacteria bacterium]
MARLTASEAAIEAIEGDLHKAGGARPDTDLYAQAAARIIAHYRQRIEAHPAERADADVARKVDDIERRLYLLALGAERKEVYRIARSGGLTDESTRKLVREIDLLESRYSAR